MRICILYICIEACVYTLALASWLPVGILFVTNQAWALERAVEKFTALTPARSVSFISTSCSKGCSCG